jgi:hypothetical protein
MLYLAIVAGLACWHKMCTRRLLLVLAQDVCQAIAMKKTDIILVEFKADIILVIFKADIFLMIFTTREISPLELLRVRS